MSRGVVAVSVLLLTGLAWLVIMGAARVLVEAINHG